MLTENGLTHRASEEVECLRCIRYLEREKTVVTFSWILYVPIELTMIMTSRKILYHIDGNYSKKVIDGKIKATSKKI